jgi:hypothetical protein
MAAGNRPLASESRFADIRTDIEDDRHAALFGQPFEHPPLAVGRRVGSRGSRTPGANARARDRPGERSGRRDRARARVPLAETSVPSTSFARGYEPTLFPARLAQTSSRASGPPHELCPKRAPVTLAECFARGLIAFRQSPGPARASRDRISGRVARSDQRPGGLRSWGASM